MKIGIDLGGTKTELVVIDRDSEIIFQKRIATPAQSYDDIILSIKSLVAEAEQQAQVTCSVGIGTPGAVSQLTGKIKNSNTQCLNQKPLQSDLQTALKREVRLANDANCLALSESVDGAAMHAAIVFAVIIGTGTGAGITINKQLLLGENSIAGEWGHNPLPWMLDDEQPGFTCYCGKRGCIETFLSGPGFKMDYASRYGEHLEPKQIASNAAQAVPQALEAMQRYQDRFARSLAHVINILDPNSIILAGGMSNIPMLYTGLSQQVEKYVFSDQLKTPIIAARHGDSSGVRGAAWLWDQTNYYI